MDNLAVKQQLSNLTGSIAALFDKAMKECSLCDKRPDAELIGTYIETFFSWGEVSVKGKEITRQKVTQEVMGNSEHAWLVNELLSLGHTEEAQQLNYSLIEKEADDQIVQAIIDGRF